MKDTSNTLLGEIDRAFGNLEVPEICEDYVDENEYIQETKSFWGKSFRQISLNEFNENSFCFAFFPAQAFPFFWGAMMRASLLADQYDNAALDMFLMTWESSDFFPGSPRELDRVQNLVASRFRHSMSNEQIEITKRFFIFRQEKTAGGDFDLIKNFFRMALDDR